MKRVISMIAVAACSGGSTSKPVKPTTPNGSGVIWQTAAEPWHVLHQTRAGVVAGDVVTLGGPDGWVFQVSLTTGLPLRERKLSMGTITSMVELGDHRILAVGQADSRLEAPSVAFTIDPTTLEPTPIKLPTRTVKPALTSSQAALVVDGGVAIIGQGLPLAIYDPKTWQVRTTLDPQLGWSKIAARGEILLAERSSRIKRFNVATNGQRELPISVVSHMVPADGAEVIRVSRNGQFVAELHLEDKTVVPLGEPIDSVHPYDGKHFLTTKGSELRLHELPSGEIKKRFTVDDPSVSLSNLHVGDKRAVTAYSGILRVFDLESGTVTPRLPGARQASWLAVGNDGAVLAGSEPSVWTLANGKVGATETLGDKVAIEMFRVDDPQHYLTSLAADGSTTVTLRKIGDQTARTVTVQGEVNDAWIARDGGLIFDIHGDKAHDIMRAKATTPELLFAYNADSEVLAVDPDGDVLISLDGRVAVVGLDGKPKSTIRLPRCEDILDFGTAEPGGPRAVTYDHVDLALWDRKTGKLIATVKVPSPEDILFLPKRDELLIALDDRVVLWTPTKGTRTLPFVGVLEPAVSADGKKLALAFYDGRIGLYDLDALFASVPLGPDLPAGDPIPETCGKLDPLEVPIEVPDPDPDDDIEGD